jgi:hypothetical protein
MTQISSQDVDVPTRQSADEPLSLNSLTRRVSRPLQLLRAIPHLGIWIGVLVSSAGAALLFIAWGRTAALTNVGLQTPYVISAGFTGLGLVAVGLTLVNVTAKLGDARERTRQLAELRELLAELRCTVEGDER